MGNEAGYEGVDQPAGAVAHEDAEDACRPVPSISASVRMMREDEALRRAQALENADLAGALQHRHVHGEADHGEPDDHADADDRRR